MIKTINTGVAELVLIKVPDDAHDIDYRNGVKLLSWLTEHSKSHEGIDFYEPEFDCKLLGIAHELTEEVWTTIVDISFNTPRMYLDYSAPIGAGRPGLTATESGLSLLMANEVYAENPLGKNRPFIYDEDAGTEREHLGYKWDKDQETTGKWVVLKKTNV